jgi:hypothetical protein
MSETNFFWDPLSDNILQERDETGEVMAEYATEPSLYGNVVSQSRGGVESQFHYDRQGSTLAVTDGEQDVSDTREYSAFGQVTASTGSTLFPFQYRGRAQYFRDIATSDYVGRRLVYDPTTARRMGISRTQLSNVTGTSAYVVVVHQKPTSTSGPHPAPARMAAPGSETGRISVRLTTCAPSELEKGCCCTSAYIHYNPTEGDKAKYTMIRMVQWARTDQYYHGLLWEGRVFSDWHFDAPKEKQRLWCSDEAAELRSGEQCTKGSPSWDDWPGVGPAAGNTATSYDVLGVARLSRSRKTLRPARWELELSR